MTTRAARQGKSVYRRLLGYVRPYRPIFLLAVLGLVGTAATEACFAYLIKPILDTGFVAHDQAFAREIPLLIIGLFLIRGIAGFTGNYCMRWVGRRVIFDLRRNMFANLIRLPTVFFDNHSSAALVSKLIYDVEQVDTASTAAVISLIKDTATMIGLLGWMFYLDWKLTVTLLILGPLLAGFVKLMSTRFRTVSRTIQSSVGDIAQAAKESIQGHRVLKAFGGHATEAANFFKANNHNRQQAMKKAAVAAFSLPVTELVGAAALSWIIYLATQPGAHGYISVGSFTSYLTAMLLLMAPGQRLTKINEPIQMGLAAAQSIFAIIDEAPEWDEGTRHLERASGRIEYRDVGFHYGSKKKRVLHDISFSIEPGQTIALVGPSGSGKTSIAALLPRFYQVEDGAILIDDININDLVLKDLRRNIALVTQDTVLFDDTVANNISYGHEGEVSRDDVEAAARAAHVMEFAVNLSEGLDTRIGEHGVRLSGGQRQRIAIARALFKNAPILVLDEATSALDSESERAVQDAIQQLIADRTTLVIAHRLSTIEHADRILVLKGGRIVESGTHNELLALGGDYARLYRTQFTQVRAAASAS